MTAKFYMETDQEQSVSLDLSVSIFTIFSSPGHSPGRAIVLPPALALVAVSALAKC